MQIESFERWVGILVFKVSAIEFGYNITRLRVLSSINQKLESDSYIVFDGNEIPLFNLGDLFNIKRNSKNKHILIFESHDGQFGFGADEIKEVLPFDEKIFENEVKTEISEDNKLLLGKIYFEGRTILLPDFDMIIDNLQSKKNSEL